MQPLMCIYSENKKQILLMKLMMEVKTKGMVHWLEGASVSKLNQNEAEKPRRQNSCVLTTLLRPAVPL